MLLKLMKNQKKKAKLFYPLNPIRLGLDLNLSNFYYEILNDHHKAIDIAKMGYF